MVTRLLLLGLLAGCGPVEPCPDGSMLDGPGGLELVESEHQVGWGQADCWRCHTDATIHKLGCTPDVDLAAIQDQVAAQGLDSCSTCHGDNGTGTTDDTGSTEADR